MKSILSKTISALTAGTLFLSSSVCTFAAQNSETSETAIQVSAVTKKLSYETKDYFDGAGRFLGNYPSIPSMPELSNKISSEIEMIFDGLDSSYVNSYGSPLEFSITDVSDTFSIIEIRVNLDNDPRDLLYYVDKTSAKEISFAEFEKLSQPNQNSKSESESAEQKQSYSKLNYEAKNFVDEYGRVLGSYPQISGFEALSEEIYNELKDGIKAMGIDQSYKIDESNPLIKFSVGEDKYYALIFVAVGDAKKLQENIASSQFLDGKSGSSVHVIDKVNSKVLDFEEFSNEISEELAKDNSDLDKILSARNLVESLFSNIKSYIAGAPSFAESSALLDFISNLYLTMMDYAIEEKRAEMVPLRPLAEKYGWKIEWQQGQPPKVILSKDSSTITISLGEVKDGYDLVMKNDLGDGCSSSTSTNFFKKPELRNGTLYVPSTFEKSYLIGKANDSDNSGLHLSLN